MDKWSGELAQLGERLVCNQEVTGSSPVFSTIARQGVRRPGRVFPVARVGSSVFGRRRGAESGI